VALVTVVLVLAALIGLAAGGRPAALTRVPLTGWRLLTGATVCQLAGSVIARTAGWSAAYEVGSVAAVVLLTGFLVSNTRLPGMPLIAAGLLLNLVAVLANGAMPVSRWAAGRAGVDLTDIAAGLDARHVVASSGTTLRPLTDVVPAPMPWFPEVVSPGDVLVAAGLGLLLVTALLWGQTGRRRGGGEGKAATGTPGDAVRDTTRASASTTRGSYS
jgi:hypothetical protein